MKEFLITLFLGEFGVHRFMQKKYITGAIWLCTLGVFGIGWAVDTVIAFTKMSKGTQYEKSNKFSGGGGYSPSRQLVKSFDTVIVGTFANCDLDPEQKRDDVIMRIKKNSILDLEFWQYKGDPACRVCYNGVDAGNLRAGLAKILYEEYKDCTFKVTAIDRTMDDKNDCLTCNIRIDIYR